MSQLTQSQVNAARFPAVPQQDPYFAKDFFVYELDMTVSLAALATTTLNFTIQADSDFLWTKGTFIQTGTGVPAIIIQDTGSGRNLSTQAVPVANFFGTGQLPFILPRQRIFVARATVNVTVTNLDAVNAVTTLRLSFIGEKGFRSN